MDTPALPPAVIGQHAVARLAAAFARPRPVVRFMPDRTKRRWYLTPDLDSVLRAASSADVEFAFEGRMAPGDIALTTGHAVDTSAQIWSMRDRVRSGVSAVWLWDNHHTPLLNLRTASATDVAIPAHHAFGNEIANPSSILAPAVPLACTQWSSTEARRLFARLHAVPRSDGLSGGFVRYDKVPRQAILDRLQREVPDNALRLVPHDQQSRFFDLSPEERMRSWMAHKVSIVLSVNRDLPLRLFDALLAGQTVIVPSDITDLDRIVPPERQRALGIVRFDGAETPTVVAAWREALHRFDAAGTAGVRLRHDFVLEGHMLEHRLATIAAMLRAIATGKARVRFGPSDGRAWGLRAEVD